MKATTILTAAERDQSGWRKVEAALQTRLADCREKLESLATEPAQRERLACRIAEIKETLRLGIPGDKKD